MRINLTEVKSASSKFSLSLQTVFISKHPHCGIAILHIISCLYFEWPLSISSDGWVDPSTEQNLLVLGFEPRSQRVPKVSIKTVCQLHCKYPFSNEVPLLKW